MFARTISVTALLSSWSVLPLSAQDHTQPTDLPTDAAAFAAVVKDVDQEFSSKLLVDPQPIQVLDTRYRIADDQPERVDPEIVAARVAVLRELGVDSADFHDRPVCAGVLVPPGYRPEDEECPKVPQAVLAVSVPERRFVESEADSAKAAAGPVPVVVRVSLRSEGPSGASWTTSDYVLGRGTDGRTWVVLRKVFLSIAE